MDIPPRNSEALGTSAIGEVSEMKTDLNRRCGNTGDYESSLGRSSAHTLSRGRAWSNLIATRYLKSAAHSRSNRDLSQLSPELRHRPQSSHQPSRYHFGVQARRKRP